MYSFIDPADQHDRCNGIDLDQSNVCPAGHNNIDKIVSDIISSNFLQVICFCLNKLGFFNIKTEG